MSVVNLKKLANSMEDKDGISGSAVIIFVFLLFGSLIFWASKAELDNVTRGEGKIISSVQNQNIQSTESGVIQKRLVTENSFVDEGQILFVLDPVDTSSELNQLTKRLETLEIREQRLQSEIQGKVFDPKNSSEVSDITFLNTERSLFMLRQSELAGKLSILEDKKFQRQQELESARVSLRTAKNTMDLMVEEINLIEPMVRENLAPKTQLLLLQREIETSRGSSESALVAISKAESAISEIEKEEKNTKVSYNLRSIEELNELLSEKTELAERIPRLEERVTRTVIRSPMAGIVSRLNYRTLGGFINAGDVVLELVPTDEALMIEAKIAPQDISNVLVGDETKIRLSAYDSSKYGSVMGVVSRISPDAITEENSTLGSFYLIDVKIVGSLSVDGKEVEFLPGMTATIDVVSGKRTILEYFWQPIAKVKEIALRD
ncbi:MAG: HlyD family type I secretion periplasmic adaptor subunit [Rhodospirillaceae bacterium]|nr:HlyD family type I secretion periplasmic adaptor subunit [Rhodospirillaceae bacterium]